MIIGWISNSSVFAILLQYESPVEDVMGIVQDR